MKRSPQAYHSRAIECWPFVPDLEQPIHSSTRNPKNTNMKINRRTMLASLAACSRLLAQEPAKNDPTLYIPKAHRVEDLKLLHDFMDEYAFVDVVTSVPTLRITHIPVILDRTAGTNGKILGHVSRQNPQSQAFDGRQTGVIVFRGPHGYISPTLYAKKESVPTWNFAVVHVTGRPSAITDKPALHKLLGRLIEKFESYERSGYDFSKLPESYVSPMLGGIVGFEMLIESLEGKFKLGQERSDADKQGLLEHLSQAKRRERSLYDLTASFYKRSQPG
jgi:transcriptional regulator